MECQNFFDPKAFGIQKFTVLKFIAIGLGRCSTEKSLSLTPVDLGMHHDIWFLKQTWHMQLLST